MLDAIMSCRLYFSMRNVDDKIISKEKYKIFYLVYLNKNDKEIKKLFKAMRMFAVKTITDKTKCSIYIFNMVACYILVKYLWALTTLYFNK